MKFIKIQLPGFANRRRISESSLNTTKRLLWKSKKPSNENILPFITTFNRNNPNNYRTIKFSVNCLKNNSVNGFHNIKLIQNKR